MGSDPDERFLRLFHEDRVVAEAMYEALFYKLVRFFEWGRASCPEDLAQETLARAFQKLQEGVEVYAPDPAAYFRGIAAKVLLESKRARTAGALPEEGVADWMPVEDSQILRIYVGELIAFLSPAERELLLMYVNGKGPEWRLKYGVSPLAMRLRLHRIRLKLRKRAREIRGWNR